MNKLPNGWAEYKLKDIMSISSKRYNPNKDTKNYKCIELEHIESETGILNGHTNSKDIHSVKNVFEKGEVLYGKLRPYLKKFYLAKFDGVCSSEIWVLKGKKVINDFLYYFIQQDNFNYIANVSIGMIMPRADWSYMSEISFNIPPLDEQKRIASALSKIDAYLENTIKLIEEKERFKRGIAKKLLTCKEGENIPEARFKGFNDDWRKEKLSSMIKIQGGYAFKSSEFKKSGIPIIRISNISNTDNNMNMKEVVYYNEIENEKSFIIKKSDLLIALSGAPGKSSIYNLEEKAYLNQRVGLFKIIDTKKINNSFLSQYVFSSIFQNKLKPFITRGVQPNISPKDIENLDILLPSLKEQEKIGGYLSLLDKEIDNLKKQKELIKEMKRGAMQKLLSGEVRLSKNAFNENI